MRVLQKTLLGLLSVGLLTATSANATIIDDFTADTLAGAWVQSDLGVGSGSSPSFDTTTNADQLTITGGGALTQAVLLRSDSSLGIGEILTTEFTAPATGTPGDGVGLAIAPATGLGAREDLIFVNIQQLSAATAQIQVLAFDEAGNLDENENLGNFAVGGIGGIFIERLTADTYRLGSLDTSLNEASSYTFTFATGGTNPGGAIGYFSDIRSSSASVFDNLDLAVIPEPSSLLLAGLGMFGFAGCSRRRK